MSATVPGTVFKTSDGSKLTTTWSRQDLRALRWADIKDATGVRRAAITLDLEKYDIRPEVRLNAAALKRFKPGATGLPCFLDENLGETMLTTEWQSFRAGVVAALWHMRREDATLGGESWSEKQIPDGYGGKTWTPERNVGEPNLIEVRLPGDVLVTATS